jgi:hypothetical protein
LLVTPVGKNPCAKALAHRSMLGSVLQQYLRACGLWFILCVLGPV